MQTEKGEPTEAAKAIQRTLNRLLIATVVLYGLLALGSLKVYLDGNKTKDALCSFRTDLEKRTTAGIDFLKEHPKGIAGISRNQLLTSLTNQQRTIVTLQGLGCKEDTPVELLVIPADLSRDKAQSERREHKAKQLASAGIAEEAVAHTAKAPTTPNRGSAPDTSNGTVGPTGPRGEQGNPGNPAPESPDRGTPSTPAPNPAPNPAPSTPTIPSVPTPPTPPPQNPAPTIRSTVCGVLDLIAKVCP